MIGLDPHLQINGLPANASGVDKILLDNIIDLRLLLILSHRCQLNKMNFGDTLYVRPPSRHDKSLQMHEEAP